MNKSVLNQVNSEKCDTVYSHIEKILKKVSCYKKCHKKKKQKNKDKLTKSAIPREIKLYYGSFHQVMNFVKRRKNRRNIFVKFEKKVKK